MAVISSVVGAASLINWNRVWNRSVRRSRSADLHAVDWIMVGLPPIAESRLLTECKPVVVDRPQGLSATIIRSRASIPARYETSRRESEATLEITDYPPPKSSNQ
jgi:hypothetical protein